MPLTGINAHSCIGTFGGSNINFVAQSRSRYGLNRIQIASYYEKMRHVGRLPRRVYKKSRTRISRLAARMEEDENSYTDEITRLSQEDVYTLKRTVAQSSSDQFKALSGVFSAEDELLHQKRLQLMKGKVSGNAVDRYHDTELMGHHRRRLHNLIREITADQMDTRASRKLKEGDEELMARRDKRIQWSVFDEDREFSDEIIEIPDEEEYEGTRNSPSTFEERLEYECSQMDDRKEFREAFIERKWGHRWRVPSTRKKGVRLSRFTRWLKKYKWLRDQWDDDGRSWRQPSDFHTFFTSSTATRLTDSWDVPEELVTAAHDVGLSLWKKAPPLDIEQSYLNVCGLSQLTAPPSVAPSVWTYPGNLVCLMNKRGDLDIYRRHAIDRDVWWVARMKLAKSFLDLIPPDRDLSATPVGDSHLAIFSFQRSFLPTKTDPFGSCWLVPKSDLVNGTGTIPLPFVPLEYFKPFSAKEKLFVIGYHHYKDKHYKVLTLVKSEEGNYSWDDAQIDGLPIYWTDAVLMQDFPESTHLEGSASIVIKEDESAIFITAPNEMGQSLITIDTNTWEYNLEQFPIPPVWGGSLVHDSAQNRLILAGGLGYYCPEPIVRVLHLDTNVWSIANGFEPLPLPAYGAAFPIGPGSYAIVGGLWRTGERKQNLQPLSGITLIETTDVEDFLCEHFYEKFHNEYDDPELEEDEADAAAIDAEFFDEGEPNPVPAVRNNNTPQL
jgi:hypothetical protein